MDRSMFIKASITTIIAAILAGGVVYYGMPNGESGSVPIDQQAAAEPVKKKWMEKYLKPEPDAETAPEQTQSEVTTPVQQPEAQTTDVQDRSGSEAGFQIPDLPDDAVMYFVYENGQMREIKELPTQIVEIPVGEPGNPGAVSKSARAKFRMASQQSKLIEQSELKDQAVIDMIDFALANGLYQDAENAVKGINQPELRDTARSRIAVSYALQGRSQEAFRMIEKVEVEALRDVMRLQTIQAMIVPERLPQAMQ